MAVTWAASNLVRSVAGDKRVHFATLTPTGTYTSGGDSVLATALGLSVLDAVDLNAAQDGTPLVFQPRAVISSDKKSFVIRLFGTNAVPGAAVADPQVTAATTVTGFALQVAATGR